MTEDDCKRCSDVLKAVENFEQILRTLNNEVSATNNGLALLQKQVFKAQGDIEDLKAGVNEVRRTIQEDESKIRQIQADVSEMKAERTALRDALERVKRDLHQDRLQTNQSIAAVHAETKRLAEVLTPQMRRIMASLPNKLAKIERLDKAGHSVMELLSSSQRETNIPDTIQDHSLERKKAASTPTQKIQQIVSAEVSSQGSAGNELQGYRSQLGGVTNPFPVPLQNVSIRDVQGLAADNDSYVPGNVSNTFFNDGNLTQRAFDGIREIEFVGTEENFTIMKSESDLGGCTGFDTSNHSASTTPSVPCYNFSNESEKSSEHWNNNELPIENVLRVMAQKLLNLQKIFNDGAWVSRVSQLEDRSALVNANLSELHLLVSSHKALDTDAIEEMKTTIANMSDIVNEALVKLEERVFTELEGRTAENTRNTAAVWKSLQIILNRVEEIEFGLTSSIAKDDSLRLMNDSLATLEAKLLALNDSVETAGSQEIMELKSQLRNLSQSLQATISDFDRRIQQTLSLTSALKEALNNVTSWLEVVNENAKKCIIAGDLKLQTRTEELGRMLRAEVEKLKQDMEIVTDSLSQLLGIQGWHPGKYIF
ncbi:hypothetical protein V5799_001309 [Amblyomma americanum]|uniref:Uncharacterized protein n=1 Tax=Amblyomma americanum TaxID=6943 RepID=A0AAQ4D0J9_AMBAM